MKGNKKLKKKGWFRKTVNYVLPFLDKYDPVSEAEKLLKDKDIKREDIGIESLVPYLEEERQKYRWLMNSAKIADSADRLTSAAGSIVELFGLGAGLGGGFAANGVEEAVEMAFKAPFFYLCYDKNPTKIPSLLVREGATFVTPVVGDAYDVITNKYMSVAYETIREGARNRILKEKAEEKRQKPPLSLLDNRH